jgi:antitoxin component HigA of HigAB toxin-antitoxin module
MALRRTSRSGPDAGDYPGSGTAGSNAAASPDLVRAFTDEVTWFMKEHKVTRADLAQAMGVSPGRVSQILSGDENLTLRTLSSVAAALGAEIELALRTAENEES